MFAISSDAQEKLKLAIRSLRQRIVRLTSFHWSQIPTFAPYEILDLILDLLFPIQRM